MILLAAGLLLAETAAATVIRIPVIRDPSGVPVQCILDPNCHNRFHPAIPPVARADPGDTVVFETRDAFDSQFDFGTIPADVAVADASRFDPLTGPLFANGGEPGDILKVTLVGIAPGPDNLRDIARWKLTQAAATSPDTGRDQQMMKRGQKGKRRDSQCVAPR